MLKPFKLLHTEVLLQYLHSCIASLNYKGSEALVYTHKKPEKASTEI